MAGGAGAGAKWEPGPEVEFAALQARLRPFESTDDPARSEADGRGDPVDQPRSRDNGPSRGGYTDARAALAVSAVRAPPTARATGRRDLHAGARRDRAVLPRADAWRRGRACSAASAQRRGRLAAAARG